MTPDWLACMSEWLRDNLPSLDDRVYTELPASKTFPLVVVHQLSDPPLVAHVDRYHQVLFQLDVWGGPKATTWQIASTARSLLVREFSGVHDLDSAHIAVGVVQVGGIRRTTDDAVTAGTESGDEKARARPKASFDFNAVMRPVASGS